jgi:hypothetical protein
MIYRSGEEKSMYFKENSGTSGLIWAVAGADVTRIKQDTAKTKASILPSFFFNPTPTKSGCPYSGLKFS